MPIYEYECEDCGRIEEVLQKISDIPLSHCKQCSGKLHKLVSHSSFHLKGSGWYVTDYAKKTTQKSESITSEKIKATGESKSTKPTGNPVAENRTRKNPLNTFHRHA